MSILDFFKKKSVESAAADITNEQTAQAPAPEPQTEEAPLESVPETPGSVDSADTKDSKRVYNLIILDESGSMMSIYQPALTGVNETLQTIREAQSEHENQSHYVSLITFDTGHYNPIYNHTPAGQAKDITQQQYRPSGGTPLYDAMGRAISELRPNVTKDDVVLVTVITDGYENASREYSGKAIKNLVEALKQEGWVFTYIGANQDVEAVAASMSIDNHLSFNADDDSTQEMFAKESRSRKKFFRNIDSDMSFSELSRGYFDE